MSFDRTATGSRLRELRTAELGLTGVAFAQSLEISASFLSDVERGRSGPSGVMLERLASRHGVNLSWLFTGEGPRTISGSELEAVGLRELQEISKELAVVAETMVNQPHITKIFGEVIGSGDFAPVSAADDEIAELISRVRSIHRHGGPEIVRRLLDHIDLLEQVLAASQKRESPTGEQRRNAS